MQKIIYTREDKLHVVHWHKSVSIEKVKKSLPTDALNVQVVDESAIPADRTFRIAWKQNGNLIEHDMGKCREIHKQRLRVLRTPKLQALDVAYMRATEEGNEQLMKEISAQKQALRDVTKYQAINEAKTPEELKSVIPECLLDH